MTTLTLTKGGIEARSVEPRYHQTWTASISLRWIKGPPLVPLGGYTFVIVFYFLFFILFCSFLFFFRYFCDVFSLFIRSFFHIISLFFLYFLAIISLLFLNFFLTITLYCIVHSHAAYILLKMYLAGAEDVWSLLGTSAQVCISVGGKYMGGCPCVGVDSMMEGPCGG